MEKLSVYAGQFLAGYLSEDPVHGLSFSYNEQWLTNPKAIPLSPDLPLSEQPICGDKVIAFFENLLPEGEILDFISKVEQISPSNKFGLLARFGGDTAGAFSILPKGILPSPNPHYLPISPETILQWFQRSKGIPINLSGEQARMSLSGAQDKMTVFIDATGQFLLPLGSAPSSHIIKPSIQHRLDIPNTAINESLVMMLAKAIEFSVANIHYAPELGAAIVQRYDREFDVNGQLNRLHQIDLCQLLSIPSGKKYESEGGPSLKQCFDALLARSSKPAGDKKRLIEWVIFNVLVGNMDGHAKNLSLITQGKQTKLAPFYDLVCTAVYPNLSKKLAFKIGGENRPQWLMPRHWDQFAQDTSTKPQFVRKLIAEISNKIEVELPNVINQLQSLTSKEDELLMIENIRSHIQQSVTTMKNRNDDIDCVSVA